MSRKKLIRTKEFPYHLTARANNREAFPGDLEYVWNIFISELYLQYLCHRIRVHAFVLMPNHFHLIVTSPERDIDLVMKEFLGSSTRILNIKCGRSGHVFGGRYFWSLIKEPAYYAHALKYVYRNPVKASLCESVLDYPFSSYACLMGQRHLPFPIYPPEQQLERLLPEEIQAMDRWLNSPHKAEQNEAIKRGLKRKEFQFTADPETRRATIFEI